MTIHQYDSESRKWSKCTFLLMISLYCTTTYLKSARQGALSTDGDQFATFLGVILIDFATLVLLGAPFIKNRRLINISYRMTRFLRRVGALSLAFGGIFYLMACISKASVGINDHTISNPDSGINVIWYYILIGQFVGIKSLVIGCCIMLGIFSDRLKIIFLSLDFNVVLAYIGMCYFGIMKTSSLAFRLVTFTGIISMFVAVEAHLIIWAIDVLFDPRHRRDNHVQYVGEHRNGNNEGGHDDQIANNCNNDHEIAREDPCADVDEMILAVDNLNNMNDINDVNNSGEIGEFYEGGVEGENFKEEFEEKKHQENENENEKENNKEKDKENQKKKQVNDFYVYMVMLGVATFLGGLCLLIMHITIECDLNNLFNGQENYVLSPLWFGISIFGACILYMKMIYKCNLEIHISKYGNYINQGNNVSYNQVQQNEFSNVLIDAVDEDAAL